MPLSKVKIRWGYLFAFILLLISYSLIFFIIGKLSSESDKVNHSNAVINNLETIKSEITDAETGVRGYIITRDTKYLKPYHTGSRNAKPLYQELQKLTRGNNKLSRKKVDSLGPLITNRLAKLDLALSRYQSNGFQVTPDILAEREANRIMMDSIRLLIADLKDDEQELMQKRDENLKGFFSSTGIITVSSLVIALFTIILSLIIYTKENVAKERAMKNAKEYSLELEKKLAELARVNEELSELKSIEKFASTGRIARTIAHEVRNPLTNISLASEQLREISPDNDEATLLLDMISRNSNRINQLVSDLLQSTRFAQLDFSNADLNILIDETLEMARDRIELNHVNIIKNYSRDLCEISVDKEKIKLAFLNIIVNAIEAMEKDNGVLRINTRKEGNRCFVEFSDNGTGMEEEALEKLFEPYFTAKPKGNGLGLTNTQNIVLNHKGTINVKSRLGLGSVFIIGLNISEENS